MGKRTRYLKNGNLVIEKTNPYKQVAIINPKSKKVIYFKGDSFDKNWIQALVRGKIGELNWD